MGCVFGNVVNRGVASTAIIARFLLSKVGQQTLYGSRLCRGADIGGGILVQVAAGGMPVEYQHGADENFIDCVAHMGKPQGGYRADLSGREGMMQQCFQMDSSC